MTSANTHIPRLRTGDQQTPMPAQQRQPIQSPNPPDHRPAPIKKASRSSPLIPLHPPQKKSCNNHPEDKPQSKKNHSGADHNGAHRTANQFNRYGYSGESANNQPIADELAPTSQDQRSAAETNLSRERERQAAQKKPSWQTA
ncbi:MAG TPA: hypothetical protein VH023_15360 [Rhodopila sp.]|nr:hypothetical protein [Rhodopila sp.]